MAKKKMIKVKVVDGGEEVEIEVPEGSKIEHIAGNGTTVFLNGHKAKPSDTVKSGDKVQKMAKSSSAG